MDNEDVYCCGIVPNSMQVLCMHVLGGFGWLWWDGLEEVDWGYRDAQSWGAVNRGKVDCLLLNGDTKAFPEGVPEMSISQICRGVLGAF